MEERVKAKTTVYDTKGFHDEGSYLYWAITAKLENKLGISYCHQIIKAY